MDDQFIRSVPSKIMNMAKNGPIGKAVDSFGHNMKNFVNNARQNRRPEVQPTDAFTRQNNKMNWPNAPQAQEYVNRPLMQRDYLRKSPANKGPTNNV